MDSPRDEQCFFPEPELRPSLKEDALLSALLRLPGLGGDENGNISLTVDIPLTVFSFDTPSADIPVRADANARVGACISDAEMKPTSAMFRGGDY